MPSRDEIAREVLDSLQEGCQVIGFDWRYLYVNDALVQQGRLAREELLGRTMMECYPGLESQPFFSVLQTSMAARAPGRVEIEFEFADGSAGTFDLRVVPVPDGICVLSLDTTEIKRAEATLRRNEEQLRQAQKMEAVGLLAGGVAHDFNNILSVILSYSQLLLGDLKEGEPMWNDVEQIHRAGARAADLTRQLLSFSRHQVIESKVLDLNDVLVGVDKMLQRVLGAHIDLVSRPAPSLGRVRADRGSIEQVVMNLAINARDAMPTGGKLTIETADVVLDEEYARGHLGVKPGPYVMLAVTDTGVGMDKATVGRIFEPFFTTKGAGKGTGLGLSTVFGILQRSGGSIWVYSEPGRGTTFKAYLPCVDAVVDVERATVAPLDLRGSETVLLVEDDEQVRVIVREILRKSGYHVIETRNAGEALLHAEKDPEEIHLLLTDVVMPQMSGPELAARLEVLRPRMKVLCMSGYTDDSVVRHGVIEAHMAFVQKPITPDALTIKVREVLDGDGRRAVIPTSTAPLR